MHLPLLSRILLLLFQFLVLTTALPNAGSCECEAPVSLIDPIDSVDPDNAGTFNPVDALPASAEPPEQPIGLRKRAWSFGRMLLPYEK
ncbi:hypothetical protein MMC08_003124 [Hypocenomyce scalaris]|nr:hypothetical protein [Hypocenomyce scalaris]